MKCAKVKLQERSKSKTRTSSNEKPRRFCQKRLVNPEHEEDPRWVDIFDRFCCKDMDNSCDFNETQDSRVTHQNEEDLFLSVQNLQFQGNIEQRTRPRTSFKYKTLPNNQKHRMFVKQIVDEYNECDPERSSELSNYLNDYTKYFTKNDDSRPSSSKSSIILYSFNNKHKENKAVQVDLRLCDRRKKQKFEVKTKKFRKNKADAFDAIKNVQNEDIVEDTKVVFHRNGKRKSLTISRTESPATVQVIRVDVVCNYSSSSLTSEDNIEINDKENEVNDVKKSKYLNKYRLTNTVKTLDQNVSGGKVTLMCKTFKLTDRSKDFENINKSNTLTNTFKSGKFSNK